MFKHAALSLCTFDLAHSLRDDAEDLASNQAFFRQRLPADIPLYFSDDKAQVLPLAAKNRGEKAFFPYGKGFYYPLRLHQDCFALLYDDGKREHVEAADLGTWQQNIAERLNSTTVQQLEVHKHGFMGQTWVFNAVVSNGRDLAALAKQAYQALRGEPEHFYLNSEPSIQSFSFAGGAWFVFEEQAHQVWVGLYDNEADYQYLDPYLNDLIELWAYQHKIHWSYGQSQHLKGQFQTLLQGIYQHQQQVLANSQAAFNRAQLKAQLSQTLNYLLECRRDLRHLDDQRRTIDINQRNYQQRIEHLKLMILDKRAQHLHLQQQVEFDYANLHPEQALLENLIDYIRTLVALEDTDLQARQTRMIAIVGSALTVGAIVASISAQWFGGKPEEAWWSLGFSGSAALVAGTLAWVWQRFKKGG